VIRMWQLILPNILKIMVKNLKIKKEIHI